MPVKIDLSLKDTIVEVVGRTTPGWMLSTESSVAAAVPAEVEGGEAVAAVLASAIAAFTAEV